MKNIVERIAGYSNEAMLHYCETLKSIITQTNDTKIGRGKKVETIKVPKYKVDQDVLDKILRSCEHYKKLNQMKFNFRDYQTDIIEKGSRILNEHGFLYLAMEVRTGKTLTSLGIAERIEAERVLFVTKKKAISTIEADYKVLKPYYHLTVINYESLHLVMDNEKWDLIICDEAHSMGAFPKPSGRALLVAQVIRKLFSDVPSGVCHTKQSIR
jgi:superfamily II DNA or RNA helicase